MGEALMSHTGIPANLFNWKAFDHDNDDKLSPPEFLEAGPAVAVAFRQIKEAHQFRINEDLKIFRGFDSDRSGDLNGTEMSVVEHAIGLEPGKLNWRLFDHDGDGQLSEAEFVDAGPTVAAAMAEKQMSERAAQAPGGGGDDDGDSTTEAPSSAETGKGKGKGKGKGGGGDDDGDSTTEAPSSAISTRAAQAPGGGGGDDGDSTTEAPSSALFQKRAAQAPGGGGDDDGDSTTEAPSSAETGKGKGKGKGKGGGGDD